MGMWRFTRLTNAFSKKIANYEHMIAIYFMHCNFRRVYQSLRVTPAIEVGDCGPCLGFVGSGCSALPT